jgi:hypothetical protein
MYEIVLGRGSAATTRLRVEFLAPERLRNTAILYEILTSYSTLTKTDNMYELYLESGKLSEIQPTQQR